MIATDHKLTAGVWLSAKSLAANPFAAVQLTVIMFILTSGLLAGLADAGSYFDDNGYHTPVAVSIVKHGNPYFLDKHESFVGFWFPNAVETLAAVLIASTGTVRAANWTGFLFLTLIAILTFRFAGVFTRDREARLSCVLLTLSVPLLLAQTTAFYNDLHLAFFYFLVLFFLTKALLTRSSEGAWLALGILVLCAGIKYTALALNPAFLPAVAYVLWRAKLRRPSLRGLIFIAAALLFVSGFYLRNWIWRGNPVFPIAIPLALRPLVSFDGLLPYSEVPDVFNTPRTRLPHPFLPAGWRGSMVPDMTADGFGVAFVVMELLVGASLAVAHRLEPAKRESWFLLLLCGAGALVMFPFHHTVPRYVLFLPLVLGLGPAILAGTSNQSSTQARDWRRAIVNLFVLATGACFVHFHVLSDDASPRTRLTSVIRELRSGGGFRVARYPYAMKGQLRIGYVSGFNNFIGQLYDDDYSNTLIPLHFEDYPFHFDYPRFGTVSEFLNHVRQLQLDYIQIFDQNRFEGRILKENFRSKVKSPEVDR